MSDFLDILVDDGEIIQRSKKTTIYRAREAQGYIYFLLEGQAVWYTLTRQGSRKIIFILGPGEMLNESVIHTERSTVFCDLIRDSRLLRIPVDRFLARIQEDFDLTRGLLEIQERRLWRTAHQLKNTTGSTQLEKKLAAKLWKLARDFPLREKGTDLKASEVVIDIDLSITLLADLLGAPRETTSRICSRLADLGYIRIERKRITVTDMEGLSQFYRR